MIDTVIKKYFPSHNGFSVKPFGNGHINDTYKVDFDESSLTYILQRINTSIFTKPEILIDNHLKLQMEFLKDTHPITIAQLVPDDAKRNFFVDKAGYAWRMTEFIKDAFTVDILEEDWQAYQAGIGYGWFANVCHKLNVDEFAEAIQDFHSLSSRINQLDEAIQDNRSYRLDAANTLIHFYKDRQDSLKQIEQLIREGEIPLRIVHNDTKINNILFRDKKAVAVIDLDTVGPGSILYDFGDALRTSANTANEDERILEKVSFNLEAFRLFSEGFLPQVKGFITDTEKMYLHKAPILMTYIMGIRFLADYINGDVYYKTSYTDHNMDRCKVQMKLIRSMELHEEYIKETINRCLK